MRQPKISLAVVLLVCSKATLVYAHGSTEAFLLIWALFLAIILIPIVLIAINRRKNKTVYILLIFLCILGVFGGADYGIRLLSITSMFLPYVVQYSF